MAGRYPGLDETGTKANLHACMAQLAFWCCLVLRSLGAERMAGEICLPSPASRRQAVSPTLTLPGSVQVLLCQLVRAFKFLPTGNAELDGDENVTMITTKPKHNLVKCVAL